ncbi:MAG: efflux RND transporter periplasmic adaptor subunit, partial [Saprospiraceae bacterium]
MKKIIYIMMAAVSISLFSCQPQEDGNALTVNIPAETPTELGDLRNMLADAKQYEKGLQDFIKKLEVEVEDKDTTKVKKIAVTAKQPIVEDFKHYAEVQSVVQAEKSVMASSETGGRLIEMKWEEGQYIKKGDLVARTDMEQVDKQMAELYTRLELAQTVLTKRKKLWNQNIGSEIEYLQAKNNVDVLNKTIEAAKFQKTKANVYSPASGVVDRVMTKQGEMAGPGAPILMIMNTSKVKVVAGVPEKYLKAVKKGQMVKVKFPSLDEERNARVSMIARTLNAANRT